MRSISLLVALLMLPAVQTARGQSGQSYGFEGALAVSVATGKNASFYNTGLGLRAAAFYDIEPQFRLAFVIGYYRYGLDDAGNHHSVPEPGGDGDS